MGIVKELILDVWSFLGFKQAMGDGLTAPTSAAWRPPLWTGEENHRRLTGYHLLEAYDRNTARRFRESLGGEVSDVREYGDAHLLNRVVMAAVLGDKQTITVPGAEKKPTGDEDTDTTRAQLEAAQTWYRDWWKSERGPLKLHRTERRAVKLGNGIYTLGWDPGAGRVRLRDYDPGMYFPAWRDDDEEFPSRVHIAWQIDDPQNRTIIRRITWDLRDADDGAERTYPWRDQPTPKVCYLTDATFVLDHARGQTIDDLDPDTAAYRTDDDGPVRDRDLGIDFVPVVSITNTIDDGDGWGEPTISAVAQVLDDLSQTDTDIQAAGATAAKPVVIVSGASLGGERLAYAPGEVLEVGDGAATILDTSSALDALIKQSERLEDRMSVNARTPAALLGKVAPSDVPSGITLALGMGPLGPMIEEMRLARGDKYELLYTFLRRMSLAGGAKNVPAVDVPAQLAFGSFLPQDKAAAVDLVRKLIGGPGDTPLVPLELAAGILIGAGFDVDDAQEMVRLIRRQDYAAALRLLDATGDEEAVRELLHSGDLPDLSGPPPEPPAGMPVPAQTPPGQQPPGTPAQPPQGAANQGGSK